MSASTSRQSIKRSADDDGDGDVSKAAKVSINYVTGRYKPRSGFTPFLHGIIYQAMLLMLFLSRGICMLGYSFCLATEWDAAGKFDDIVFMYKDGAGNEAIRCLQAKHRWDEDDPKSIIKVKDLLKEMKDKEGKKSDFSLQKYFDSYLKIKQNPLFSRYALKDLIICTNICLDKKLQNCFEELVDDDECILKFKLNKTPKLMKFKLDKFAEKKKLKALLKSTFEQFDQSAATTRLTFDEAVDDFFDKLVFAVNQPNNEELNKIITQELGIELNLLDSQLIANRFYKYIFDWIKEKPEKGESRYLTRDNWGTFLNEAVQKINQLVAMGPTLEYRAKISGLGLSFDDSLADKLNAFLVSPKQILILTSLSTTLSAVKIDQTLGENENYKSDDSCIFLQSESLLLQKDRILNAFDSPLSENLLIIECAPTDQWSKQNLFIQLSDIIKNEKNQKKKIILIAQEKIFTTEITKLKIKSELVDKYKDKQTNFADLKEETKNKILDSLVNFQGKQVKLGKIVDEDSKVAIDGEIILKIANGEIMKIGNEIEKLGALENYYIPRKFNLLANQNSKEVEEEEITMQSDKLKLLSAEPGMGKSTVTTKLENVMKERDNRLLVIRVNLNDHTKIIKDLPENLNMNSVVEFFQRIFKTKEENSLNFLKTLFENRLKSTGLLVVFFDGFDEISQAYEKKRSVKSYQEKVINLIEFLTKFTRVDKVWLTTRPHLRNELENRFGVISYTLKPFEEEDQKELLKKFWTQSIDDVKEIKLDHFIDALLDSFCLSIRDEHRQLVSIPLQTMMLAEAFQEEFRDFNKSSDATVNLPKINLVDLYLKFVDRKFKIVNKEKIKDEDHNLLKNIPNKLFERIVKRKHKEWAFKILFPGEVQWKKVKRLNAEYLKKYLTKEILSCFGIVQIVKDSFSFLHRTYAEFFMALYLIEEIKNINKNKWSEEEVKRIKIFMRAHLYKDGNKVIRKFFDHLLVRKQHKSSCNDDWHLLVDVLNEDVEAVERFVNNNGGTDLTTITDSLGRTALHLAASYGCSRILEVLLTSKCWFRPDIDTNILKDLKNEFFSWSPLNYADKCHHWAAAELLLKRSADSNGLVEAKANVETGFEYNRTLLHVAAGNGFDRLTEVLIDKFEADQTAADNDGKIPLHLAVVGEHINTAEILLVRDIETLKTTDRDGITAKEIAIFYGKHQMAELLNKFASFTKEELFLLAAATGQLAEVKRLLDAGVDVDCEVCDFTALPLACMRGHLEVVEYLTDQQTMTVDDDWTHLFHLSVRNGRLNVVKFLTEFLIKLDGDVNPANSDGYTTLHVAAQCGQLDVVCFYIEDVPRLNPKNPVDINVRDRKWTTPLNSAAFHGNFDIVKYLIDNGADVNAIDNWGMTVLFSAICGDHNDLIKFLLDRKAKIDCDDQNTVIGALDFKALHVAAVHDNLQVVRKLVEDFGIDVNSGKESVTPLHAAVAAGNLEVARYLVNRGADKEAVIKLNRGYQVLEEQGKLLEGSSMESIVNKTKEKMKYFTLIDSFVCLTPFFIFKTLDYKDEEVCKLLEHGHGYLTKFKIMVAKQLVSFFNVSSIIKTQISALKKVKRNRMFHNADFHSLEESLFGK